MNLGEYFEQTSGRGVLATADAAGQVNAAIYARPHFSADGEAVFIMAEHKTHHNLLSNPSAVYLFMEAGAGFQGRRLYLTKTRDEEDERLVREICQRCDYSMYDVNTYWVVYFKVDKVLTLVGDTEL